LPGKHFELVDAVSPSEMQADEFALIRDGGREAILLYTYSFILIHGLNKRKTIVPYSRERVIALKTNSVSNIAVGSKTLISRLE